jgi:arsenical pump membrane protein
LQKSDSGLFLSSRRLILLLQIAWQAVLRGSDVYAFLAGIMALSEIARYCGVFDWIASALLRAAGDSRVKLFFYVYALGTLVTIVLSNDTTAVVLTPAIATALARTDAAPLPYLYACAFVANAASFVLPIANPANLVVFDAHLPSLRPWLYGFGLASLASIVLTYAVMAIFFHRDLRGRFTAKPESPSSHPARTLAAVMVSLATIALVVAAAIHADIGATALIGAIVALAVVAMRDRSALWFVLRHIAWHVIALVAVLFIVVTALDRLGALALLRELFAHAPIVVAGVVIALLDNLINNLPVALASGTALGTIHAPPAVTNAAVVAVDLGPNLSVTGSLATLLWLIALKRDGLRVTFLEFLRAGAVVTAPALIASLLLVR